MAAYDLEEQEQIENFKAWWKQYGNRLTAALCVIALTLAGWQGWRMYQNGQSGEAGILFAALQQAIGEDEDGKNAAQVKSLTGELSEKYGGTAFAPLGVMTAARYALARGDAQEARLRFAWVAEQGEHELADLARLRLAGLLLDAQEYDEAVKLLKHPRAEAFSAAYTELEGDAEAARGDFSAARKAYQTALSLRKKERLGKAEELAGKGNDSDAIVTDSPLPVEILLEQKLDALGSEA
ncbi:MAG: tetratricopeptide repeat protein [Zoogloeaceae bacterium]|jgi:predicted negative regulator of RcsB-dependent stress response|nr:tetratricopeptide repeat protein [Zoogloeaceae bacterium]